MRRRTLLERLSAVALATAATGGAAGPLGASERRVRVRPGTPRWPAPAAWNRLRAELGGRLQRLTPAFAECESPAACSELFRNLKNPYYINGHANVTQTLGWADAWKTQAGAFAVAAQSARDVAAAVNFAREHHLRVAVRGGAHSYQGTSNAPDSLVIWTRAMNGITLHDGFVPHGSTAPAVPAVSLGAGCIWAHAYAAVTTQHGRYVQGGGCATVGVAGLISGGGFGSFSKRFGIAAAGLLEAEIVTPDGRIRIANAGANADLFWALKGGGGGTFGIITRVTLRTHDLPENFGAVIGTVKAGSDAAFRRLIDRFTRFYAEALHDEHWGEQAAFTPGNALDLSLVFQGLDQPQAQALWQPFLDWLAAAPGDYTWTSKPLIAAVPARHWWDPAFFEAHFPQAIVLDPSPGAAPGDFWWAGNTGEAGQFLLEYESLWMPAALLEPAARATIVDALFRASRNARVSLHYNKGLSGAPPDVATAARDTATNPAVIDAFALAIIADSTDNVYPGVPGHEPDMIAARAGAARVRAAMQQLRAIVPNGGAYVSEASYFDADWQRKYWGANYARLARVKRTYDPTDLLIVHHGVGSERWSRDGFTERA